MPTNIVGSPPWFPTLAEVMDPAPELLDELATSFAPLFAGTDPDVYFTALHCYVLDQLMGRLFEGPVDVGWVRKAA